MRIDVVSIFPGYLDPLSLSLPGRARQTGLVDLAVHDLRAWTHDRHRTVDDTPYGGGAGMVMTPGPWGEALDDLGVADGTLVVPTPAGEPFGMPLARELSTRQHLLFACGRYEGIDQRVVEHYRTRTDVREISIGDVVLNGGEAAALVIIETVLRLLPGFLGNPESLAEESHEDGLLEYPVFTKPASWRGLDVPPVLLSGDHAAIGRWRREQQLRRTADRRPDLLHASAAPDRPTLRAATSADAGELLTLQRACWLDEQAANPDVEMHALHESLDDVRRWLGEWTVLVAHRGDRLVGAARGRVTATGRWDVGRLMVAPDLRGEGLGRWLLERIEAASPPTVEELELFTGAGSDRNLRMYRRAGYRRAGSPVDGIVRLVKRRISG